MITKAYQWIRTKVTGLSDLRDKPHAVALGVASGTFFGFIPLLGLKTLMAMGAARLARANVVAAALAVTLHDVLLPLAPFILRWEYQFGYWLLSHPHHLPPNLHGVHHGAMMWFHWSTLFTVGMPLLLGAVLVGIPFALGFYFVALRLLQRAAARRAKAAADETDLPAP